MRLFVYFFRCFNTGYLKNAMDHFNVHGEQLKAPFIHHQIRGKSHWFVVHRDYRQQLKSALIEFMKQQMSIDSTIQLSCGAQGAQIRTKWKTRI